ncbi:NIPSNAP family protein [Reyranella sp.]|uniref:NIPSNAP family protein n=1 Tax=Reyranella sp. TaxID=1929291 RepID=UPI003783A169
MIFEMRTYLLKPGTGPAVEEAFGASYPARAKLSRIAGFWRTEVGTLNQIIHIWPYENIAQRESIRAEAVKTGVWPPPNVADNFLEMETKILYAAPFSKHFEPAEHGGLYEFRTYTYSAGAIPKVIEAWAPRIEARTAISPLVFAGYTEIGPLNQWVHIWAYRSMADRETRRAQAMKPGLWPPPRHESVVLHKQTSTFAVPAKWSPLR